MPIHIGKIIQSVIKTKQIDVTEFAVKINYTRGNVYKIFKKASIETDLLIKISKVLDENLFLNFVSDEDMIKKLGNKVKSSEILTAINELKDIVISRGRSIKKKSVKKSRK